MESSCAVNGLFWGFRFMPLDLVKSQWCYGSQGSEIVRYGNLVTCRVLRVKLYNFAVI